MVKCSFCGDNLKPGIGKMLVLKSGNIRYFCSKKCEKNWRMKRDSKKVRWTEAFRKQK